MKTNTQLADRLEEVILNGTWVANTNFRDQLKGTSLEIATTEVPSLNTLAALAQHIHYYVNGVMQVFKGGDLTIRDAHSFDFPPMQSQEQWNAFLERFWNDTEEFVSFVRAMSQEQLMSPFVKDDYGTYQRNIDGMIEHSYYHLGQIVLIKKLILNAM